ncbi:class I SAM-dependent methyltransferase [Dictyobacter aurantiacus]|uniref:SAM-dependent methyltransferase n=1 Tax=Dictyobacter aurantiacus TaxID=1936993 RepID=A0A401ZDH4_9CHLR|nr:class I SAM-dependent methyltransferase [Dictyobacter aurantiacus]GCE04902.1 SAM-dependent methyltransferase [Dictyobacter aurantiacus]
MRGDPTTPINFHAEEIRNTYATRQATGTWKTLINHIVEVQGRTVADIGCGGGIYAKALADMGAAHITCIDSSDVMISDAQSALKAHNNISYVKSDAGQIPVEAQQFDIVLERALIHHLKREELNVNFAEALRILRPGGILIVQDRTPEDCLLAGSQTNIRGYFFTRYPKLAQQEVARRHDNATVMSLLHQTGFRVVEKRQLWETRQVHNNFASLEHDLKTRTGRSILHELNDAELDDLCQYIRRQIDGDSQAIVEQDRWTIWSAMR